MKIAGKLVLSRLPVPQASWARLNVFRHSYTSGNPDQLVRSVQTRIAEFESKTGRMPSTVLELGPGEITTRAVIYRALGVEKIIFVDVGDFGAMDVGAYLRVASAAERCGLTPPALAPAADRSEVFARCGVEYHLGGLAGLARIPTGSADLITSTAVIEHIRRAELEATFAELRRILTDDGLAAHVIDFHDHLGGSLVNLKFAPSVWESDWMSSSGFYTNRLSASQVVDLLERTGHKVDIETRALWPVAPITRAEIAEDLRSSWTDEDLRICSMRITARSGETAKGQDA